MQEGAADAARLLQSSFIRRGKSVSNEKRILLSVAADGPHHHQHWPVILRHSENGQVSSCRSAITPVKSGWRKVRQAGPNFATCPARRSNIRLDSGRFKPKAM
jgi:hypothetical protein